MTLEYRKHHLLQIIQTFQQEDWIISIEDFINNLLQNNKAYLYAKPLQKSIDIASLIQEQNYQQEHIIPLFGALEEDVPFETLLNDLSA